MSKGQECYSFCKGSSIVVSEIRVNGLGPVHLSGGVMESGEACSKAETLLPKSTRSSWEYGSFLVICEYERLDDDEILEGGWEGCTNLQAWEGTNLTIRKQNHHMYILCILVQVSYALVAERGVTPR